MLAMLAIGTLLSVAPARNPEPVTWVSPRGVGAAATVLRTADGDTTYALFSEDTGTNAPNWKCVWSTGCPAGTTIINGDGNYVGCGSGCAGSCTACSGSGTMDIQICTKSPGDECNVGGNFVSCGIKGIGTCGTNGSGNPDSNGCYCTPPTQYPGSTLCRFRQCTGAPI
ncbi:MAG: hypothetical protein JNM07_01425 [Phycisphaerae bacterium]|nr:hypothetical protein [Phycisphaerae bacterium]